MRQIIDFATLAQATLDTTRIWDQDKRLRLHEAAHLVGALIHLGVQVTLDGAPFDPRCMRVSELDQLFRDHGFIPEKGSDG